LDEILLKGFGHLAILQFTRLGSQSGIKNSFDLYTILIIYWYPINNFSLLYCL